MKNVLIINNRNVGFFSVFLQIINTLIYIDNDSDIIPIIELTKKWGYGTECVWKQFFDPLNSYKIQDKDNVIYTDDYYPSRCFSFKLKDTKEYPCFKKVPCIKTRIAYSKQIKSHIKFKNTYKSKFDKFYENNLKDSVIIGVNFRGTDARDDSRRTVPEYSVYKNYIDNIIKNIDNYKIFCASDEKEFIKYIDTNYPNKTYYNHESFIGSISDNKRWIGGIDSPSYISKNPIASLEGALFDYYILTTCNYLIFHQGSISLSALLTNPEIVPIVVKEGGYKFPGSRGT